MAAKVSDVLRHKGHDVVTVAPQQTVASVVKLLTQNRIGAAPVIGQHGEIAGIISERDIIRAIAEHAEAALKLPVERLMTRQVRTCAVDEQVVDLMRVMTVQRIRHLPVIENGELHGIVSIGDVVKRCLEELQVEVEDLQSYIRSS